MKLFAFAVLSFAVLTTVSCDIDTKIVRKAMLDVRRCIKEKNLSPDVAYSFLTLDFDKPSNDFKCLFKCLALMNGGISPGGDLMKENMIKLVSSFSPGLTSEVSDIWEQCAAKVPKVDDLCEYTFQLSKCAHDLVN